MNRSAVTASLRVTTCVLTLLACSPDRTDSGDAGARKDAPTSDREDVASPDDVPSGDASQGDGGVEVGPAGAVLVWGRVRLAVPPGALERATRITLGEGTAPELPSVVRASPVYRFGPDGLRFARPARLTITHDAGGARTAIAWSLPGSPGRFELLPSAAGPGATSALLDHFSEGFVTSAWSGVASPIVVGAGVDAARTGEPLTLLTAYGVALTDGSDRYANTLVARPTTVWLGGAQVPFTAGLRDDARVPGYPDASVWSAAAVMPSDAVDAPVEMLFSDGTLQRTPGPLLVVPTVRGVLPSVGPVGEGFVLRGERLDLLTDIRVSLGAGVIASVPSFRVTGTGEVSVSLPSAARSGPTLVLSSRGRALSWDQPSGDPTAYVPQWTAGNAPALALSRLGPSAAVGQRLRVEGAALADVTEVRFTGASTQRFTLSRVTPDGPSVIDVVIPSGVRDGVVRVSGPRGEASSGDLSDASQRIWRVMPTTSGQVPAVLRAPLPSAGALLDVLGEGLAGVTTATLNSTPVEVVSAEATRVRLRVPASGASGQLRLSTPGFSVTRDLSVVPFEGVTVDALSPTFVRAGDSADVTGRSLGLVTAARVGAAALALEHLASPTSSTDVDPALTSWLRVTVPLEATTGALTLAARYGADGDPVSVEGPTLRVLPVILRVEPSALREGGAVTLLGGGFRGPATVRVDGGAAVPVTVLGPTRASATLSANIEARRGHQLELATPDGVAVIDNVSITTSDPIIDALDPPAGRPGARVTVRGSAFLPGETTVRFGGRALPAEATFAERIELLVPDDAAPGLSSVSVATPFGEATVGFRVLAETSSTDASTPGDAATDASDVTDAASAPADVLRDAANDVGPDAATPACPEGQERCAGACRDLLQSARNCGACGVRCGGGSVCRDGRCEDARCAVGDPACACAASALCDRACVDLMTDRIHCGACGNACDAVHACQGGACVSSCQGGTSPCHGRCADLQTDRAHCGACGRACATTQRCVAGACVASTCPPGRVLCGGACVDTSGDPANCGACGAACPPPANGARLCQSGRCGVRCNAGFLDCDGAASNGCEVDGAADRANCGACGRACGGSEVCAASTCAPCGGFSGVCDGACVDLLNDRANCGACRNACGPSQSCGRGVCSCPSGLAACGAACVDTQSSAAHCGRCGNACAAGSSCVSGACVTAPSCGPGEARCGGSCVPVAFNNAQCGRCGNACAAGLQCFLGECRPPCVGGAGCAAGSACVPIVVAGVTVQACVPTQCVFNRQVSCGGPCVDPLTNPSHCGWCGNACAAGISCINGACGACAAGQTLCAGACVNTQTSAAHCGACGRACGTGQSCVAGACACPSGQTLCSGACVNTQTSDAHCGRCANACAAGQSCVAGACGVACTAGQTLCSGACVNLATSARHCGSCGFACPSGQLCASGFCGTSCAAPLTRCPAEGVGFVCQNLRADPTACGACGTRCAAGQICAVPVGGTAPTCQTPVTWCTGATRLACDEACVNHLTDRANCGGCHVACARNLRCVDGACVGLPL